MYCRYCGKELPVNSDFCINCGKSNGQETIVLGISDSQKDSMEVVKRESRIWNIVGRILLVIAILVSLLFVHNILTYFFADYYNLSNYGTSFNGDYNESETENHKRKSYAYFPSECFYAKDIGDKYSDGDKSTSEYIYSSDVKLISRYGKHEYDYKNGYRYYQYYVVSTFDISELMKEYSGNEDQKYNTILEKLNLAAKDYPYNSQFTTIDGKKAIVLYTDNEKSTKRLITCANNRMYFLETSSEYNLEYLFSNYCSQFRFNSMHADRDLICYIISLIAIFILVFSYHLYYYKKGPTANRYSYSLFVISIISFMMNLAIASCLAYSLYTEYYALNTSVYVLAGSLLTAICVSMPLCVFYIKKSKQKWTKDFKVPLLLRNIHYNSLGTDMKRSTYTTIVCIPLMVLSLLPLGIYIVILYCVPLLLIYSIIVSYQRWHSWVKDSKN